MVEQVFFNVPLDRMKPIFKGWVKEALDEIASASDLGSNPELLNGTELCKKLDITRQTLGRWRKGNRIPYVQVGGVIRYDLNKVVEALENRKKKGVYNV